jgi:diguanylate cyclase (GGDEF)-like protein
VKRAAFVLLGGFAVGASYWAVLIGQGADATLDLETLAGIALPGFVSALVLLSYMAWDARNSRDTRGAVGELSAQLVRKEIEIDRLSTLDELTGLHTRHHFDENIKLEFQRCARYGHPLAMVLMEIDDLVAVGEPVGGLSKGYLLSEVGAILRTMLRANDIGCRYTNEVLAALLPETSGEQAMKVADRVRSMVAEREFLGRKHEAGLRLTVSQGICVVPQIGIESHRDFVRGAEQALADARSSGADQIRLHAAAPDAEPEITEEPLAS